jgi:hypothetical protein
VGTVITLYRTSTISLQAAVHPKYTLGALNMKEEEEELSPNSYNFLLLIPNIVPNLLFSNILSLISSCGKPSFVVVQCSSYPYTQNVLF